MLLQEKYFCFTFSVKKKNNNNNNNNNNKITTVCLSNFKGPIVSYLSAVLSCEQRPFFLVTLLFLETLLSFVILRDREESKVESCKPAKLRASQETNPTGIGGKG